VRARIAALAGMAEEWAAAVRRWRATLPAGDAIEQYTIFQTLAGAWPIEPERLTGYMLKALREAKRNTSWVEPDADHEESVLAYCRGLYESAAFMDDFVPFAERLAAAAEPIALRQTALKLTVPGVPDIYQGDELVALSLVDPDNRRPVDWARRRELLGAPPTDPDTRKLWLIRELLALRARRPEAFAGSYEPLDAGPDTVAFARGGEVVVAVPVRGEPSFSPPAGGWSTVVELAGIRVLEHLRGSAASSGAGPGRGCA
jgi:(1->4)-alpha-D-glucan 1-alpha-D-glucosylmutase